MNWLKSIWQSIVIVSRAGGGGSSSGGGSSGGGSFGGGSSGYGDSGDGDLLASIIVLFAFAVGFFVAWIYKLVNKHKTISDHPSKIMPITIGLVAVGVSGALLFSDSSIKLIFAVLTGTAGVFTGASMAEDDMGFSRRRAKYSGKIDSKNSMVSLKKPAAQDATWDKAKIIERAKQVFFQYQSDWASKNLDSIQTYTTSHYFNHVSLMLGAIKQMNRHSDLSKIRIHSVIVTNFHDDGDDKKDCVTVKFRAQMRALYLETVSGKVLQKDSSEFIEYWNFVRQGEVWLLDSIDQATEDPSKLVVDLKAFAEKNDMYFSPDWGHSLIPTRGQLFQNGFVDSDINNHVIGLWKGNLIVQLYTYSPDINATSPTYYIIGQINLPKSYGGIMILRRERSLFKRLQIPKGYAKYELEWGEFNDRYNLLATDADKFTSFELLNPAFMAWLYDRNLKVNIEVVDNVVYLYAKVKSSENRYGDMLEVLSKSHAELKM